MIVRKQFRQTLMIFLIGIISTAITSCDTLEPDNIDDESGIELQDEAIYITPQSPGIIDLQALIQSSQNVKLAISSQPRLGILKSLGNNILQYTPNNGVMGRDAFRISISSMNNIFIKEDSVTIIIGDSTALPCGVWAMNDYVNLVTSSVDIDVLQNDTICNGDKSTLSLSIPDMEIDGIPVPKSSYGTVTILPNGKIRYTRGQDYKGNDKFIYSIIKPENIPAQGDAEVVSHAYVYITSAPFCKDSLVVEDDFFVITLDSINRTDSVYLHVTRNDSWCNEGVNKVELSIKESPQGTLLNGPNYGFNYILPANAQAGFTDRFKYRMCVNEACKEAEVKITCR
jgi:hypothetical protein